MNDLTLNCPTCGHNYQDMLEFVEAGLVDRAHCEHCTKPFFFALFECDRCENEQAYSWPEKPPASLLHDLKCNHCGAVQSVEDESVSRPHEFESGKLDDRRVSADGGRLNYLLKRTSLGVVVERKEMLSKDAEEATVEFQMLFTSVAEFDRFLDSDPRRFVHPLVFHLVRREFHELIQLSP